MTATNWLPGILVLVVSLTVGLLLAFRARGDGLDRRREERRADLLARKDALLQQLRELDDGRAAMDPDAWTAERARVEREAAETLRALDHVDDAPAEGPPARRESWGARNPRLSGALWGGGVVAFALVLWVTLDDNARPRPEGGSVTGNAQSAPAAQAVPAAAQAELDALQAAVDAAPDDLDAKNRLAHAKLAVGDVMGAFELSEQVVAKAPDDPEARTHQGVVLLSIGDAAMAGKVLDRVLAAHPEHVEALGYRGVAHLESGEREAAVAMWEKARALDPSQAAQFDRLVAMAKAAPAAGDPSATAPVPELSGEVRLPEGVTVDGGTLFVFVRPVGVDGGPPTRAKRLPAAFPATFTISAADAPMGGTLSGEVEITAKLDRDGDPSTKSDDDLVGKSGPLAVGAAGVVIELR